MLGLLAPGLRMGGGGTSTEASGGGWSEQMDIFIPGADDILMFNPVDRLDTFIPGAEKVEAS